MPKGVRSARGETVDFDLLRIKENLGAAPKASTVKAREDFIDNKFKRRLRRLTETVAKTAQTAAAPVATEEEIEDVSADTPEVEVVAVEPTPAPAPKKKIVKPTE